MKTLAPIIVLSCMAALFAACSGNAGTRTVPNAPVGAQPAKKTGYNVLYRFQGGTDGSLPFAGLAAMNGALYGTTEYGGAGAGCTTSGGCGTVFSVTTSGTENVIYAFKGQTGNDGEIPYAGVLPVSGVLYGTTSAGGFITSPPSESCTGGVIFSVTTSGQESIVHYFCNSDGVGAYSPLIAANGALYGTTRDGGPGNGQGIVFEITPSGGYQIIHVFSGSNYSKDGKNPSDGGLSVAGGALYGTTLTGGGKELHDNCSYGFGFGCGTVFSIGYAGSESVVYSFPQKGKGGNTPNGGVILVNGMLYGTTSLGGANDCGDFKCGTLFEVSPSGTGYKVLHQFKGNKDGGNPNANLIYVNGMLYGTTVNGGGHGPLCCGTIFQISPSGGDYKVLYRFGALGSGDGAAPYGALTDFNGELYGTTHFGGTYCDSEENGCGTIFEIDP